MIDALVIVVLVATGVLAVYGLVVTVANRPPDRYLRLAAWGVAGLLAVQAVVAAFPVLFGGVRLTETSTYLIYLVVSVCVLPIAVQWATAEPTRWGGAVIAAGAVATAVAVLRLQGLWSAGV